jgi:purine-nucleoside phosphorylase
MLSGRNPLVGPNDPFLGPSFPPTSNAYDSKLQRLVMESASRLGLKEKVKKDGVYCFVSGPMYESKAGCRFLRNVGGDAVGMSMVRGHKLGHQ